MEEAVKVMEKHSAYSKLNQGYVSLFKELWMKHCRKGPSGEATPVIDTDKVVVFGKEMLAAGWKDWHLQRGDVERLGIFKETGLPLRVFAEWSESDDFDAERAYARMAVVTPAHGEWKAQGGSSPAAPTTGEAELAVVDWAAPRAVVVTKIAAALRADGFFVLVNHGVPHELVSGTLGLAREFFARRRFCEQRELQEITMRELARPMMKCARGYSDLQTEALNPVQGPDLKETFDFSLRKEDDPGVKFDRQRMHLGANLWPNELPSKDSFGAARHLQFQGLSLAPPGFRAQCEAYQERVYQLSRELLVVICEGAGVTAAEMERTVLPMFENPLVVSRLIRYPNHPNSQLPSQYGIPTLGSDLQGQFPRQQPPGTGMGAGSHVDYGALTLIAEDCAGLEVQQRGSHDGPWRGVVHQEGAFVVNTGFVLEKLTNGLLPATRHRVQNRNFTDRYSLALFLDPNPDCKVAPLESMVAQSPNQEVRYEACVAGHKGVRFGDTTYLANAARRA
eukprot:CAMPEP_0119129216 /NCGR_PEP_ID=MMETSP1310-20130426/7058_1 /TAXON_ID=464262 /ORGANISM="Genus nov. species nov., Strain RCC2339" /LENGTH=506 /DNA_ID=CAMNT_0007119633 /DNA_START=125 /DNA_END=1645 /DNA_ORIENTATION=-